MPLSLQKNCLAVATKANSIHRPGVNFLICAGLVTNYFKRAGWSSLVARQAYNLKVAGSNPAPATNSLATAVSYRVYVVGNRAGKFYIGLSNNTHNRVNQHYAGESK